MAGGRVAPVKDVRKRQGSFFSFRRNSIVEVRADEAGDGRSEASEVWEPGSSVATEGSAQYSMSRCGSEADGGLDWDRWLQYRLAPGGPLVLVDALRSSGLAGRPDLLRAAIEQVESHGQRLLFSLDQTPCPEEVLRRNSRGAAGSAGPAPGLWTWATARLKRLEDAEQELGLMIEEASGLLEKCWKNIPPAQEELPKSSLRGAIAKRAFVESVKEARLRRPGLKGPGNLDISVTVRHIFFVRSTELITEEEKKIQDHLSVLDKEVGLRGSVRESANDMLKTLKDAQETLFDRFVEFRSHIVKELNRYAAPGVEFSPMELARRLERIILIAQREIGARLLLGDAAIQAANKQGVGLKGESEATNPWAALRRSPPPWEASFRQALERLAQLRRVSVAREVFIPWDLMESLRETTRRSTVHKPQASGFGLPRVIEAEALLRVPEGQEEDKSDGGLSDVSAL